MGKNQRMKRELGTDRGALFAYPIRWEYLDGSGDLMEKRIIPWIKKKLIE